MNIENAIFIFNKNKERYTLSLQKLILEAKQTPFSILKHRSNDISSSIEIPNLPIEISAVDSNFNGIHFHTKPLFEQPIFGSPEYKTYSKYSYALDRSREQQYWKIAEHEHRFNSIAKFDAFDDLIVSISESVKLKRRGHLFNVSGWLKYFNELLEIFYPDFKLCSVKKRSVKRYLKSVNVEYDLYFEYDEAELKQYLRRGSLTLPRVCFGIYRKSFDISVVIGDMKDPVVLNASMPLDAFYANETINEVAPGVFDVNNQMIAEYLPDEKVRLYNSQEFSLSLIKHLYFYMDKNRFFVSNYLHFWEDMLNEM